MRSGLSSVRSTGRSFPRATAEFDYVDQASTEDLRRRYTDDPNVAIDKIVAVSHVWKGDDLAQVVGGCARYDYAIASHVIEHIPDPLGWLEQLFQVLRPGGIVSLAVPDKRFTFDYFREITPPADLLEAYWERRRRPTPRQVFDLYAHAVHVSAAAAWERSFHPGELPRWNSLEVAMVKAERARDEYVDCHCTVWTPEALLQCLRLFTALDLLAFDPVSFHYTQKYEFEFFLTLRNDPTASKERRLASFDALIARCSSEVQLTDEARAAITGLESARKVLNSRSATFRHLLLLWRRKARAATLRHLLSLWRRKVRANHSR